MANSLWDDVHDCFSHDDGSLPGIKINKLSPHGMAAIYAMLRARSRLAGNGIPVMWSLTKDCSIPIDSVPNAAALVAAGEAATFHVTVRGINSAGVELPVLGLFIGEDNIEIDYKMGMDWQPATVLGFFQLLRDCCALDPSAVVVPEQNEGPPSPDRFADAWERYRMGQYP